MTDSELTPEELHELIELSMNVLIDQFIADAQQHPGRSDEASLVFFSESDIHGGFKISVTRNNHEFKAEEIVA